MNLDQFENGSFACLTFRTAVSLDEDFEVSENTFFTRTPPFELDDFWRQQIGLIEIEKITDSNATLIRISREPDYERLKSLLHDVYYGLILQGVGYNATMQEAGGMVFGGVIQGGRCRVSSLGEMLPFRRPHKVAAEPIELDHLAKAKVLAEGIRKIYSNLDPQHYFRLRKGFGTFVDGLRSRERHVRIHMFVRALEALLRPTLGKYKKQFVFRCGFFSGDSEQDNELLSDLYELRSRAEHLNPLTEGVADEILAARNEEINRRVYQAELLAAFIYRRIFSEAALLPVFETDTKISELWVNDRRHLIGFWGRERIDLHDISHRDGFRYRGYLDFL